MEIAITYNNEAPEAKCIDYVVRNCMIWEGVTVVLTTPDVEKHWTQLILATDGSAITKVDNNEYKITFPNGSTIQVQQQVTHDSRSQCEIEYDKREIAGRVRKTFFGQESDYKGV